MFSPQQRRQMREALIAAAQEDHRISGIALTGSASVDSEDGWSDMDPASGVREQLEQALADFSARMYARFGAVDHVDVRSGSWIYRVFFLESTLQVDLAFAPAEEFRALAPTFRLVHGEAR